MICGRRPDHLAPLFNGQPRQIGQFIPLAAAGTFFFDGNRNASRSFTLSFWRKISSGHDSGPYKVNSGCKGSATFSDGTWRMVVIDHGREIKVINAKSLAWVPQHVHNN